MIEQVYYAIRDSGVDFAKLAITSAVLAVPLWLVWRLYVYPTLFSPYRHMPGPARESVLYGNLEEVFDSQPGEVHTKWARQYGGMTKFSAFVGEERFVVSDPVALTHILIGQSYNYEKPTESRATLARVLGKGVLFAEGDDHKRQRKIINPSFGPAQLRELMPVFWEASYMLRDQWDKSLDAGMSDPTAFKDEKAAKMYRPAPTNAAAARRGSVAAKPGVALEVMSWLSRATLDIIGQAGFGFNFASLDPHASQTKLGTVFSTLFNHGAAKMTAHTLLVRTMMERTLAVLPIEQIIAGPRIKAARKTFKSMDDESRKIVEGKRQEVLADAGKPKDLISLLIKATLRDAKMHLTDTELQGQMTTFILAGHETTSTYLSWTLWRLALNPKVQDKLREEVRAARRAALDKGHEEMTVDELNAMHYMDCVLREVGRLDPPVPMSQRTAQVDDVVPLGTPVKSPVDGKMRSSVNIKAGTQIIIAIAAYNRSREHFGQDADEFRPERWDELGNRAAGDGHASCGVWSPLMTFLAGARACIGFRFALLELKTILVVLLERYAFALRDDQMQVEHRVAVVQRPVICGEEELGFRLPLTVTRVPMADDF